MRIGGAYVGLGLGDSSEEIKKVKAFLRSKFSYARHLSDTPLFDRDTVEVVAEMQYRYKAAGKLIEGRYTPGVVNAETKYVMGYLRRPAKPRPMIFTIEGHLANMFIGPTAEVARTLEAEGVCRWQPVGYDNVSLPFNNRSGIDEFRRLLSDTRLLPPGTPWGACIYSQGAIVGSEVFLHDVFNPSGALHWRAETWRGTIAFGSPYRERNSIAEWVFDPPRTNTRGISNVRMSDTASLRWWKDVARHGDIYAENEINNAGEHKTAIYMAVQNQWTGDPDSLLSQVIEIVQRPIPEVIAMAQAIVSGAMFLGNMQAHAGYDIGPCVDFMRSRLT